MNIRSNISALTLFGLASASTLITTTAIAQTASGATTLEEIIVTARKREETLLDAPLAISAFTQTELEDAGFDNIIDVSKATPGLFIEKHNQSQARVNLTPRFRGIFLSTNNRLQQTATVFLDGVAMSGGIETIGIGELQRIEIIKGPQSALFGRNTFAGAINYVTKDPSEEFQVSLDTTIANRGEQRFGISMEGAITQGLYYRVGGAINDSDGHYDNIAEPGERLGDESDWNINASLLFKNDSTRLKLRASYREIDDGQSAATGGAFGPATHNFGGFLLDANCDAIPGTSTPDRIPSSNTPCNMDGYDPIPAQSAGETSPFFGRTNTAFNGTITGDGIPASEIGINTNPGFIESFRQLLTGDPRWTNEASLANDFTYSPFNVDEFGLKLDETRLSANFSHDFSDNLTLGLLAGYSEESYGYWTDFDLTPDDSLQTFIANEIEDTSIEARLSGVAMNDRLSWAVGASYVDVEITELAGTVSNLFFPVMFGDAFRTTPRITGAETLGLFFSLDYQIDDQWSLTLEGRDQEDTVFENDINLNTGSNLSPYDFTNFVPRATIKYEPSDRATLYFTYSEGNLPGGFNPEVAELDEAALADLLQRSPGAGITFDEEKLVNHELGWKQTFDDSRGRFNLALFYMERSNEIFRALETAPDNRPGAPNPRRTVSFNNNGATTDIYGIELDTTWSITEELKLSGSIAYIDASIASFPAGGGTDRFGLVFGPNEDVAGQQAPRFPPFSFSTTATYDKPFSAISGFDTWFVRGDLYYTGGYYTSNANLSEIDTAVDVNLRAGFRGEKASVELFITNLLDENTPSSAQTFADVSFDVRTAPGGFFNFNAIGNRLGLRDKRQLGLRAKYAF